MPKCALHQLQVLRLAVDQRACRVPENVKPMLPFDLLNAHSFHRLTQLCTKSLVEGRKKPRFYLLATLTKTFCAKPPYPNGYTRLNGPLSDIHSSSVLPPSRSLNRNSVSLRHENNRFGANVRSD